MADKPRILVLGGGFGGAYCVQELEKRLGRDVAEISLVDRNNFFVFYPLLVEAGTGSLEPRHAVVAIRSFLDRARFRMGEVESIDLDRRSVTIRNGLGDTLTLAYDHLVLALGSVTRLPPVPGLAEHGFQMKSMSDAVGLRDRAIRLLEIADTIDDLEERRSLLHFVVVGGNFTGAEVAGEFHVLLRAAARRLRNVAPDDCAVTLVELSDRILGAIDEDLSRYGAREMTRRGIEIRLGVSVASIDAERVVLSSGEVLQSRTTIWCAGIAPHPLLTGLGVPADPRGYLLVERSGEIPGHPGVWGIGDSVVQTDDSGTPLPPTAQRAVQEGQHVARNIARDLRGEAVQPFRFRSRGSLAALGCRTAVARVLGFKLSGFPAWFLWRTVYLMKMPGWSRRVRIALDWTADLVFRSEYVELGLARRRFRPRTTTPSVDASASTNGPAAAAAAAPANSEDPRRAPHEASLDEAVEGHRASHSHGPRPAPHGASPDEGAAGYRPSSSHASPSSHAPRPAPHPR